MRRWLAVGTALLCAAAAGAAPDAARCGTLHALLAHPHGAAKTAATLARPFLDRSLLLPSGRIRIHYTLEGRDAVAATDADDNGLPDYIDEVAAALDSTWRLQIDQMGYAPPPGDDGEGGGDEYDVYVLDKSPQGFYGLTVPAGGFGLATASHLEVDNNFTDAVYRQTRGIDALNVTVAHEFFHAVQFGYYAGRDGLWWQEACSTWIEDVAYPEVDDYLQYIPDFMRQPGRALNNAGFSIENYLYGTTLFAHFLERRYGRELLLQIWEEIGRARSPGLEHFDRMIRRFEGGGLAAAIPQYAVWNFFTAQRADQERYYPEGAKYAAPPLRPLRPAVGVAARDSGAVDHLGSAYFLLEPQRRPGGALIDVDTQEGSWARQLVLVGRDSTEVRLLDDSPVEIRDWDRYFEIALVLTSREQRGSGYRYSVSADYDPALGDGVVQPLALRLGQNHPNPFRPGVQPQTRIGFELPEPADNVSLSIFGVDGRLVYRFEYDGPLPARAAVQEWDGRNEAGAEVAAGVYYYVLDVDGRRLRRSLAVVR